MDESRYRIRPFCDDDYELASRIDSRLNPDFPVTAEEIRQWHRIFQEPNLVRLDFVVEDIPSGVGVALGTLNHDPESYDPHRFWCGIDVDPDHQHRGIGRALFEHLEGLARARSVETLWASVKSDDARSVRFFERTGFTERRRMWMSRLSLAMKGPDQPAERHEDRFPGVTFTTLAEEGADRREVQERIYRLDLEASRDAPRMGSMTDMTFEQYAELAFRGPRYYPEAVFLGRVGNDYVSMTTLHHLPAEPDVLIVGFTGTRPSYRGRGLASELKRRAVEFARAQGYLYLRTFNDSENPKIWAINQRLGFQVQRVWVRGEKGFAP